MMAIWLLGLLFSPALQELLDSPNISDPANMVYETYKRDRKTYDGWVVGGWADGCAGERGCCDTGDLCRGSG